MRQATQAIYMPLDGTVYDYMVDVKTGIFIKWSDRPMEKPRSSPVHYSVIPQVRMCSSQFIAYQLSEPEEIQ